MKILDSKIPSGALADKWDIHKSMLNPVSPHNRKKLDIIIVGTGLAGASAASSLGEHGYNVKVFCFHDSPRRAHSVAAQGGINAAKNYKNDGDSIYRLFLDTIRGGDYRSREANVYRVAELSNGIIDHYTALGVPFARDYGGMLDTRSFGGVQVSRTFYAKGQTGQQCLLGAYSSLNRQITKGTVTMYSLREMVDLVIIEGKARGIIVRNIISGKLERHSAHAVVLATGGYGTAFYLSTLALGSNPMAAWAAHKKGAFFANPGFIQIHPTCIPVVNEYTSKQTLMSESLRNDGRTWVPVNKNETRHPNDISEDERDYYLERQFPAYGNLVPRDVGSRAAKEKCDQGYKATGADMAVYLDFRDAINIQGKKAIKEKYGNLFEMYEKITGISPYNEPMKIYPAAHYSMGGLWVDYNLMTTIQGLFAIGESNFSDHGANRLGANSLMQCSADGYFILPYTIADYLSNEISAPKISTDEKHFEKAEKEANENINKLINIKGRDTVSTFHKRLGKILWDYCGIIRNEAGLTKGLSLIKELENEFSNNLRLPGKSDELNQELDKALRLESFFGIAKLMCLDALNRKESCGAHFREESKTESGETLRNDDEYSYVAAWEYKEVDNQHELHKEPLIFEFVKPKQRSYK